MISHTIRVRFVFGLLVSLAALAPLGAARAQSLGGGMNDLEDAWRKRRVLASNLLKGKTPLEAGDKNHIEALDVEAKYLTYRVYLDTLEVREEKTTSRRPTLDRAFRDVEDDLKYLTAGKPGTQAAADIFRDQVRLHAKEVIDFEKAKPIHKLFNARVLAEVAKLGQGQLVDTLVEVLKDEKQNDGVRFYALRGLRNLLGLVQPMQMPPLLTKAQETKAAEALVDFLEHRQGPPKAAPKDEIDGFRVLRREAIRALAPIHAPSLSPKVRPALLLARFAGADERIAPEPRIDEQVEAAIGLARMTSAQDSQYQPDYAANQIGRCIALFAQKANGERGGESSRPWRIDAYRLNEALKALKADSKNAYVATVVERGSRVLDEVMQGQQPKAEDVTWFFSPESEAPSKELFKGMVESVVKPAKPAEAPTEK